MCFILVDAPTQGHFMEKATWLQGDLPNLDRMQRRMTKRNRNLFKKQRDKLWKNSPAPYIVKKGQVQGTKALAKSAIYTVRFCQAIVQLWYAAYCADLTFLVLDD